jgi:hypothetical protein
MAESTPNADATSDASATPAGVAEAVPAPTADELGDTGTRALAALRRELKEAKTERDALAAEKRAAEDADRSELDLVKRENDELKATAARVRPNGCGSTAAPPTSSRPTRKRSLRLSARPTTATGAAARRQLISALGHAPERPRRAETGSTQRFAPKRTADLSGATPETPRWRTPSHR